MKDKQRSLRKAAVLVASLDAERAEGILALMSPAQAQAVREAMAALGPLDPAEQHEVIEEFFRIGPLVPDREPSGIALDDPQCARLLIPSRRDEQSSEPAWRGFDDVPADALAPFLEREHPQTIAVVLSRLPSERAAEVLAGLPSELQIEIARRLIDLDEADPEIIAEIERGLETWLRDRAQGDRRRAAGMAALNSILEAACPRTREHILANLADHDQQLGATVETPPSAPANFADVEQLSAASLKIVMQQAGTELLVLALAGARGEFVDRALELFPPAKAQVLRRALSNLGPTRLSDIEDAQQRLAELSHELEKAGQIAPVARRQLSVAV